MFDMSTMKLGADPEFFLIDRYTGEPISAHNIIPGTKDKPHPLKCGGALQVDGVAVEFNIKPASTADEFYSNMKSTLDELNLFIDPNRYNRVYTGTMKFKNKYFDALPEKVKELGCNPDFNAYLGKQNDLYEPPRSTRTGSGHLHIGFTEDMDTKSPEYIAFCCELVKYLDAGLATQEALWDIDPIRPTLYGRLGCFRPKSYGLEYRTLSNSWLNYPKMWKSLFTRTKQIVANAYHNRDEAKITGDYEVMLNINLKKSSPKDGDKFLNFEDDLVPLKV